LAREVRGGYLGKKRREQVSTGGEAFEVEGTASTALREAERERKECIM